MKDTIKVTLSDGADENPRSVDVVVDASNGWLCIQPEGYGDLCSKDGEGTPVLIELYEGELRVVVWDDINQEDHTHLISLEGAREDRRDLEE
jgi:hypothetical protein